MKHGTPEKCFILQRCAECECRFLLAEIGRLAELSGCVAISLDPSEDGGLVEGLIASLCRILQDGGVGRRRETLAAIQAFAATYRLETVAEEAAGESQLPFYGNLERELPLLPGFLGEQAKIHGSALVLLVNKLHLVEPEEFRALVAALHWTAQRGLPVVLFAAAAPEVVHLVSGVQEYAEMMFAFVG